MRNAIAAGIILIAGAASQAASDFQFTVVNSDITSWTLESDSSPLIYSGTTPALDNPAITLIVGARYQVTDVPAFAMHPFQIIANGGSPASDVVLLSAGSTAGTLESDPDVAWTDDLAGANEKVEFTVTQALVAAMRNGGNLPGYRCGIHTTTMRGDVTIIGEKIANPVASRIPMGNITIELETVADGLVSPLGAAFPDDGSGRMFVYDQPGFVWVYAGGARLPVPFLDVSSRLVPLTAGYDERGLLGVAIHPDFAHHPKVYTHTSEPVGGAADFTVPMTGSFDHQDVIAEWTVSPGNPNVVNAASRRELLRNDHPESNHNGGAMRFGPDGYLYFTIGDGGAGDDQGAGHAAGGNAQNTISVLGKIMRIDVDGGGTPSANGQYGIPSTNPFVGNPGAVHEIYAYGLRNPYQFSFDKLTGDLYVGDTGQDNIEEIDRITAGGNYGWRVKEGSFFFNPNGNAVGFVTVQPVVFPVPPDLIDPIAEYDHDDGEAIVGGAVYRGSGVTALQGRYVFGDLGTDFAAPSGRLFYLDGSNQIKEFVIGTSVRPFQLWLKGFAQDPDGNVYVCGSEQIGPSGTTGKIQKIVAVGGPKAAFSATPTLAAPALPVRFSDLSTPGVSPIADWKWDFGDGVTSIEINPTHAYLDVGVYTVSLTVTTAVGADVVVKRNLIIVAENVPISGSAALPALMLALTVTGIAFIRRSGLRTQAERKPVRRNQNPSS